MFASTVYHLPSTKIMLLHIEYWDQTCADWHMFEVACVWSHENTVPLKKLIFCLSAVSWPQSMRPFSGLTQRIGNVKSILAASVMSGGVLALKSFILFYWPLDSIRKITRRGLSHMLMKTRTLNVLLEVLSESQQWRIFGHGWAKSHQQRCHAAAVWPWFHTEIIWLCLFPSFSFPLGFPLWSAHLAISQTSAGNRILTCYINIREPKFWIINKRSWVQWQCHFS